VQVLHGPIVPPQPSPWTPQVAETDGLAQVSATHDWVTVPPSGPMPLSPPQVLGTVPPPQNWGFTHVVQLAVSPPQPSLCCPQVPAGSVEHVAGTHTPASPASPASSDTPVPQRLGPPPPQKSPAGQSAASLTPHVAVTPPHPSLCTPQVPAG
jgi:hypothetical protein